jgi:hypothetical protein
MRQRLQQYQDTSPEACRCRADDAEASLNPRIALYEEYVSSHTGLSALLGQALLTAVGDEESAAGGVAPPWPLCVEPGSCDNQFVVTSPTLVRSFHPLAQAQVSRGLSKCDNHLEGSSIKRYSAVA